MENNNIDNTFPFANETKKAKYDFLLENSEFLDDEYEEELPF